MTRKANPPFTKTRWFMPMFCLLLGAVILAACWLGGHPAEGLYSLGVMAAAGAIFLFGGRSETIRGLRGDGRDERFAQIDLRATAVAGLILILVLIAAWLVRLARGESPGPYDWLLAVSGVSYLLSVAWFRWRG
ncbi:MAG: hypothetical protein ACR2FU_07435 [Streptosporangiaceae bacterium]